MGTRVHHPVEVKWNAVNMKLAGYSSSEAMKILGIKNNTQAKELIGDLVERIYALPNGPLYKRPTL